MHLMLGKMQKWKYNTNDIHLKILSSCGYSRSQTNASCQPLFPYLPTLLHRIQTTICQILRTLLDPTTDLKAHTLGISVVNQCCQSCPRFWDFARIIERRMRLRGGTIPQSGFEIEMRVLGPHQIPVKPRVAEWSRIEKLVSLSHCAHS